MTAKKTATKRKYDLRASQVATPFEIVRLFWDVVHSRHRAHLGSVLDLGAGDGRFSRHGKYDSYLGIELDPERYQSAKLWLRPNARLIHGCAFAVPLETYDACIGNPPYLRHQDISSNWKRRTLERLSKKLDVDLSGHSNLFIYFLALGLLRAKSNGLLAFVVPFDWVTRPSAASIRSLIEEKKWEVSVYRFKFDVFPGVETTASISVIDKSFSGTREWQFFDVNEGFEITRRSGVTGSGRAFIGYTRAETFGRKRLYARRGLSAGSQRVFTLTEAQRIELGLWRRDVKPCITTLRGLSGLANLDWQAFERRFVRAGRKCWLIRSRSRLSPRLKKYLRSVPRADRDTATCRDQRPWYRYEEVRAPKLLVHSALSAMGVRVAVNKIGAIAVGAMYGVYGCKAGTEGRLRRTLLKRGVGEGVVPHSGRLRKLEVGQLNTILGEIEGA